jgi:hypothetical protein
MYDVQSMEDIEKFYILGEKEIVSEEEWFYEEERENEIESGF